MPTASEFAALAIDIAQEAGELARRRRTEGVAIAATKSVLADIVTEADREVEDLIRVRLRAERPDDGFYGEESGAERGTSDFTWIVDPIDGTVNYAFGIPIYAVSIAVVSGEPQVGEWTAIAGAVFNPASGELFHGARGDGAWHEGRRLAVSTVADGVGALLATGFGYDTATHAGDLAAVGRVMPLARDLRRAGSAALDLSYVAAGRLDGYFERGLSAWDHAAGALLVSEAGGRCVVSREEDSHGRRLVVASSPALFERLHSAASGNVAGM